MTILYVTDCGVDACSHGNEQRTRLLYEALEQIGDVYILQASNREEQINSRHWLFHLEFPNGLRRKLNGLWSRFFNRTCPRGLAKYYPFPLQPGVRHFFPDVHFDAVVSRHLDFANSMHLWRIAPLFVDLDDHPMEVFKTRCLPLIPHWRHALAVLMQKLTIWAGARHATGIWVANPLQEKLVSRYGRTAVLPNIPFSVPESIQDTPRQEYVLTVGRMSYAPNHEGVARFIKEVWPQIRVEFPSMRYLVGGWGVPDTLAKEWSHVPGVSILGFVDNLTELYAGALATVVPIYSGGGTCIKVLESMAYSRVCLSSEFGARGIPKSDIDSGNCGVFVYQNVNDFISYLGRIVRDAKWRKTEELSAREYVIRRYSRKFFFNQVHQLIGSAHPYGN